MEHYWVNITKTYGYDVFADSPKEARDIACERFYDDELTRGNSEDFDHLQDIEAITDDGKVITLY